MNIFIEIKSTFSSLSQDQKKNIFLVGLTQFITLFSYPIIRSSVDSMFLHEQGAKNSPLAWTISILVLSAIVSLYNIFLKKAGPKLVFILSNLIFTGLFFALYLSLGSNIKLVVYPLFILKEVYIVLLVHSAYAFINSCLAYSIAKKLYGFLGAFATLGGVFGGILTSTLSAGLSTESILLVGVIINLTTCLVFFPVSKVESIKSNTDFKDDASPFKSIAKVKKRVFYIALVVALSQFVINIANFKFNVIVGDLFSSKAEKTSFLGNTYSAINLLCFLIQVIFVPILYKTMKEKSIQMLIPLIYLSLTIFGYGFGAGVLPLVAGTFILFKGIDYSLFSTAKEIFYFHFTDNQKYGAKYITDMIVYRFSKGLISFFLIYLQTDSILNTLLYLFLIIWIFSIYKIFKEKLPEY